MRAPAELGRSGLGDERTLEQVIAVWQAAHPGQDLPLRTRQAIVRRWVGEQTVRSEVTAWTEALEAFRASLVAAGQAPEQIRVTIGHLNRFSRVEPDPWAVTASATDAFVQRHRAAGTASRAAMSLRAFYRWALDNGLMIRNPAPPPWARYSAERDVLPVAWQDALADWRRYGRAAGRASGTMKTQSRYLLALARTVPDPFAVTEADLLDFLGAAPDWAPETRRSARSALRVFYRWAATATPARVSRNPAENLPAVRIPITVSRPAPAEVVTAALSGADTRTALAVLVGRLAGLRCAEIASLHVDHVEGDGLRITGKGTRTRLIPLHPELGAALEPAVRAARERGDGWLFPRLTPGGEATGQHITAAHVGILISRVLGPGWSAHKLRHAAGTAWYAHSRDLLAVQQLLGHSSPETTQRYVRLPDDALRSAVLGGGFRG